MSRAAGDPLGASKVDEAPQLFEETPFEDGFSWRIVIGALFVGIVMLPGAIYMGLISGRRMAGAAEWVTIILFIEIGKRSFIQMRKQEIILLFWVAAGLLAAGATFGSGVILFGGPFGSKIWDQFLIQSPQAEGFGIADKMPWWFVPSDPQVLTSRSFFHKAWLVPILLLIGHVFLSYILMLAGGYVLYRVTNDIERLPFPLAPVNAGGATALAESSSKRETWRWRVFSIGAMIGVAFGAVYLGVPTITGIFASKPIMILPIPFADWTADIGKYMPSALFGIVPDLALVIVGFVLPFPVVLGIFFGSIGAHFIGNPVLHHLGILTSWEPGLDVRNTDILAKLDIWISFGIGMACFVALLGLGAVIRRFWDARGREPRDREADRAYFESIKERGDVPMWFAVGVVVLVTLAYVWICHKLVPGFPLWILLVFGFVVSPLFSYVQARMIGITGSATGVSFPYLREATFILSGYKGVDIWFAPLPLYGLGKTAEQFKQLELTRSKFKGLVKSQMLAAVVMLVCSFFFWSLIWSLQSIPSAAYPYVERMWPYFANIQCIWVSSTLASDKLECEEVEGHFEVNPLELDPQKRWPQLAKGEGAEAPVEVSIMAGLVDLRGKAVPAQPPSRPDLPPVKDYIVVQDLPGSAGEAAAANLPPWASAVLWVVSGQAPTAQEREVLEVLKGRGGLQYWISARTAEKLSRNLSGRVPVQLGPRRNFLLDAIRKEKIFAGFGVAVLIFGVVSMFGLPAGFFYGSVGGLAVWPHMAIPQMIGALLGRFWFQRKFGRPRWRAYVPILLAGYACGSGLVAMLAIGFALLAKAISRVII